MGTAASASGGRGPASVGTDSNTGSGGNATSASGANVDSGTSTNTGTAGGSDRDGGSSDAGADRDAGNAVDAGAHTACKRGIATNTPPGAAFFPAISWWYNWSMAASGTDTGIEFVPMTWGKADVAKPVPAGSQFLLTFNEPNFHAQANLTPEEAASSWPMIEAKAKAAHVAIVGPGMNFCGPASDCNGTSPYQYLKDFFAACSGCQIDYIAVHWYNCDLASLQDYLSPAATSRVSNNSESRSGSRNSRATAALRSAIRRRSCVPRSRTSRATARVSVLLVQRGSDSERQADER